MASRADLEAAAAAGIIGADQAGKLHDFLASRAMGVAPPLSGEEELRFIRNFHDLFLAIGIALFAAGMGVGIGAVVASSASSVQQGTVTTGVLAACAALVMWVLGELFARRRRLFLPAIATVIAFTLFAVVSAALLYFGLLVGGEVQLDLSQGPPPLVQAGLVMSAAMFVIAPAAFYARFRLPFSLGMAGGGAALFAVVLALVFAFERAMPLLPGLYLVLGVALFVAGAAFDARDPARASRLSDNGFWLHFAAAPFILNGAFGLLNQLFMGTDEAMIGGSGGLILASAQGANATGLAAATLAVVAMLGFISLLINRRVLIVSALITTGVAIGILMNELGLGAGAMAATTLLVLGGFVLVLGAGWHGARRALLGWVKPDRAWARIFPPEAAA